MFTPGQHRLVKSMFRIDIKGCNIGLFLCLKATAREGQMLSYQMILVSVDFIICPLDNHPNQEL